MNPDLEHKVLDVIYRYAVRLQQAANTCGCKNCKFDNQYLMDWIFRNNPREPQVEIDDPKYATQEDYINGMYNG